MSWLGLDIMEANHAIVKVCGHSFDPCYLSMAIEKQAIFPRLRSEYEVSGLTVGRNARNVTNRLIYSRRSLLYKIHSCRLP